jgi:hypothetical protein
MGTWDTGSFDNDAASDYVAEIIDGSDLTTLEATCDRILSAGDNDVEAPDAQEALAAAEIIARLAGHSGRATEFDEDIDEWIKRSKLSSPDIGLVEKGRRCVTRILREPSELLELWKESEEFDSWKSLVIDLGNRLKST